MEEQKLRAERDALHAEVARGAGGGRSGETTARDSTSSPAVATSGLAAQSGTSQNFSVSFELVSIKPPQV